MARAITGVVGGVVVWILIATIGNLTMRAVWPGYAAVEAAMRFTPEMMICRLLVASLAVMTVLGARLDGRKVQDRAVAG